MLQEILVSISTWERIIAEIPFVAKIVLSKLFMRICSLFIAGKPTEFDLTNALLVANVSIKSQTFRTILYATVERSLLSVAIVILDLEGKVIWKDTCLPMQVLVGLNVKFVLVDSLSGFI